jgi:hypothetical protein
MENSRISSPRMLSNSSSVTMTIINLRPISHQPTPILKKTPKSMKTSIRCDTPPLDPSLREMM